LWPNGRPYKKSHSAACYVEMLANPSLWLRSALIV